MDIMIKDSNAIDLEFKLIDFNDSEIFPFRDYSGRCQVSMFRAPENFLGKKYDETADIWSLGVTVSQFILREGVFTRSPYTQEQYIVST